jgi:hypothetical protein
MIGEPYHPRTDDDDFYPYIPEPVVHFSTSVGNCFKSLTFPTLSWWSFNLWSGYGKRHGVRQTIKTAYFAIDTVRKYITMSPFEKGNVQFAAIIFNAVFEVVGLPSLNIDFKSQEWAGITLKAVDGNSQPLLEKVLEKLVYALNQDPPII